jgi:hypothetical protein
MGPSRYSLILIGLVDELKRGVPGFAHSQTVVAQSGARGVTVRVLPTVEIEGHVEFKGGAPPGELIVEVSSLNPEVMGTVIGAGREPIRSSQDHFRVKVPRGEQVSVEVSAPGFVSARTSIRAPESGMGQLELVLEAGGQVRGRVVDEQSGEPIAGAVVTVLLPHDASLVRWWDEPCARTGEDGYFTIDRDVRDREVILSVEAAGFGRTYARWRAEPGGSGTRASRNPWRRWRSQSIPQIRLARGVRIEGRVSLAGKAVSYGAIRLDSSDLPNTHIDTGLEALIPCTNFDGSFELEDVRPGRYTFSIEVEDEPGVTRSLPLEVPASGLSKIHLELGYVRPAPKRRAGR